MQSVPDSTPPPRPRAPAWLWGRDGWVLAGLALLVVVTRWPRRAHVLTTTDSVLFALGMQRYNVFELRPHAPGYPVYIALAKTVSWFQGDPNTAMVALSVLLSAGAVAVLYGLLREFTGLPVASAGALLFTLAPAFLFNGIIATSYAGEALVGTGLAWVAWRYRQAPGWAGAALLGALFSVALGFRQSVLLFLAPLVAFTLLHGARGMAALARRGAAFAATFVPLTLAWLVPAVVLSGGIDRFRQATSLQTGAVVFAHTVFTDGVPAWQDHWGRLLHFLHFDLPVAVTLLGVAAGAAATALVRRSRPRWGLPKGLPLLLALWLVPAFLFYLLVFDGYGKGPLGYVLVVLPGLYAIAALVAEGSVRHWLAPPRAAWGAALLLLLPAPFLAAGWSPLVAQEVSDHDDWSAHWQQLETAFPANGTAIVASYSWAHVKWYFPDYITWSPLDIQPERGRSGWPHMLQTQHREDDVPYYGAYLPGAVIHNHTVPAAIRHVVLFDFQLAGENGGTRMLGDEVQVREGHLADGWRILYFDTDRLHPTIESYFRSP